MKRWLLASCITLSGCAMSATVSQHGIIILKPQITSGQLTQTTITPYDKASIQHLTLKLFIGAQDTGISKTLLNAQLDNAIVFSNLKAQTTYRVKAYAYTSADDSVVISLDDANSWTDITLTNDDRPMVSNLKIKLIDRAFSGQATASGVTVTPGGYQTYPESMHWIIPQGFVTTLAGNGSASFADGTGTSTCFNLSRGIAVDSSGNIYVADTDNQRIRKITSTGVVSTFAGNGGTGFADGQGTSATFNNPYGVSVDGQDNIYVADNSNHAVRKITPSGLVTTIAGNGVAGSTDGAGSTASFYNPINTAVDTQGNIYVADFGSHRIRKVTPGGVVTTLAGNGGTAFADGQGTSATFNNPRGVAVDTQGNIYVADQSNHRIRKITPGGAVTTIAGNGLVTFSDGIGTSATFNSPSAIAIDDQGNLFIADSFNHRIRLLSGGRVTTIAGNGNYTPYSDGLGTTATFKYPRGIAVDNQGHLFVIDTNNHRIRKIQ